MPCIYDSRSILKSTKCQSSTQLDPSFHNDFSKRLCLEYQGPVVIANPLRQIEIRVYLLALNITKLSSKDRNLFIIFSFGMELDICSAVVEILASPLE